MTDKELANSKLDYATQRILSGKNTIILGPAGCVDGDTEYMSPVGWKSISQYTNGESVLQYKDTGEAEFVVPELYHKLPTDSLHRFKNKTVDMVICDDHKVVYYYKKDNLLRSIVAKDVVSRFTKNPTGFTGRIPTVFSYGGIGLDITEGELRLQVAVMADGKIVKGGKDNYTSMRFNKVRKYNRLISLCNQFNLSYKDNGKRFNPNYKDNAEYEVIVWPRWEDKTFCSKYYNCSNEQLLIILDEVKHWDGCIIGGHNTLITSTMRESVDFIQFASHATGSRAVIVEDKRSKLYTRSYCADVKQVRKGNSVSISKDKRCAGTTLTDYKTKDGFKYCFTVPSGMFVARRSNKIFITGNCGKSELLKSINYMISDQTVVTASTGLAATNCAAEATTFHRALGIPVGVPEPADHRRTNKNVRELFNSEVVRTLVLDEMSMTRADSFIYADATLKKVKRNKKPFGGMQMTLFGDLLQLGSIIRPEERQAYNEYTGSSRNLLDTNSFRDGDFEVINLEYVFRQTDPELKHYLYNVRNGLNLRETVDYFNHHCYRKTLESDKVVQVGMTNRIVDQYNLQKYNQLTSQEKKYTAIIDGKFKDRPVPDQLKLREGCVVMFAKNDEEGQFVNGTVGKVVGFRGNTPVVEKDNGERIYVKPVTWRSIEYKVDQDTGKLKRVIVGSYMQVPLKISFAVTAHKCQGQSLSNFSIDFRNTFAEQQAYVALSRCTDIRTMSFNTRLFASDIKVDYDTINFLESLKNS